MPATITNRRFDVHEYHRMAEAGILRHDDRVQLIDGEVVVMAPIGNPHQAAVDRLTRLFVRACGDRIVRVQGPVRLDRWSEPQPDLSILLPRDDFYEAAHPTPPDVLLVVEVADTSLSFDRETKLPLYAKAGILEYWIVNLKGKCLEVYREPGPEDFALTRQIDLGESISPAELPEVTVRVDDIL